MADIAEALGVAKGTLYLYVKNKEALFDLAVRYADSERPIVSPPPPPVHTPQLDATLHHVREPLMQEQSMPALASGAWPSARDAATPGNQRDC